MYPTALNAVGFLFGAVGARVPGTFLMPGASECANQPLFSTELDQIKPRHPNARTKLSQGNLRFVSPQKPEVHDRDHACIVVEDRLKKADISNLKKGSPLSAKASEVSSRRL